MNTKTLALGLCLALATTAGAQNKQGGISAEMLQNIEKTQKATTTADKALFNALASNKIDDLAKNFGNNRYTDDHFSVETAKQSIHNQKSSGRCWMFSSFNVLRSDFARNHGDSIVVDFSHVYLFFFDQLEKANLMFMVLPAVLIQTTATSTLALLRVRHGVMSRSFAYMIPPTAQ